MKWGEGMFDFFYRNFPFVKSNFDLFQFAVINPQIAMLSYLNVAQQMMTQSDKIERSQQDLLERLLALQKDFVQELCTDENKNNCIDLKYNPDEQKFNTDNFESYPIIRFSKKFHETIANWMLDTLETVENVDPRVMHSAQFFMKQYIDLMSPDNFPFLNPSFWKETIDTQGKNIKDGLNMLLNDIQTGVITTNDRTKFKVGKNLAITKGKVIYRNDLIELIQYSPSTKQVFAKPILFVPPWINKFYILDLSPELSFVKWAVDNGLTVFMISWVNPEKKHRNKGFEEYISEGLLESIEKIYEATGEKSLHTFGYCVGGTLISALLAYISNPLCRKHPKMKIESATLLTTLLDFDKAGDLAIFMAENYLEAIGAQLKEKGYLDGQIMFNTFSTLKAKDMIWRYYINSYMLGKKPVAHEILYWNSDPTNITESMQVFLSKDLYRDNLLKTGTLKIFGVPIDLTAISTPIYMVSMIKDHLVPWKATFDGMKLFNGNVTFVLGGSGHVAGAINPPGRNKYCYWTNKKNVTSADEWMNDATKFLGSWWNDWLNWIKPMMGEMISAQSIENYIEDAPGIYVLDNKCKE